MECWNDGRRKVKTPVSRPLPTVARVTEKEEKTRNGILLVFQPVRRLCDWSKLATAGVKQHFLLDRSRLARLRRGLRKRQPMRTCPPLAEHRRGVEGKKWMDKRSLYSRFRSPPQHLERDCDNPCPNSCFLCGSSDPEATCPERSRMGRRGAGVRQ
jgi:hypothetical protein